MHVGRLVVVLTPELLDDDLRSDSISKPFQPSSIVALILDPDLVDTATQRGAHELGRPPRPAVYKFSEGF